MIAKECPFKARDPMLCPGGAWCAACAPIGRLEDFQARLMAQQKVAERMQG